MRASPSDSSLSLSRSLRLRVAFIAFIAFVAASGFEPIAHAQAPHAGERAREHAPLLALDWNAEASCPSASAFESRVRVLAGEEASGGAPLRVRASVTREDRRYVLSLIVEDRAPRQLVNDDCRRLTEAAAVIVALDLEAHQRAAQETRPTEIAPPPKAVAETAPETPVAPNAPALHAVVVVKRETPSSVDSVPVRMGVEVENVFDVGSLPSPTSGLQAGVYVERGPWSAVFDGTVLVPRDASGARPNAGAEVRLAFGSVRACGGVPTGRGRFVWRACLGGEAGESHVEGYGISRPISSSGLWLAASVAPELEVRWSPGVALVAGLEAVAPIRASKVTVEGVGTLFDPPPAVFRATLGLRFTFFRSRR